MRGRWRWLLVLALVALVMGACGNDDDGAASGSDATEEASPDAEDATSGATAEATDDTTGAADDSTADAGEQDGAEDGDGESTQDGAEDGDAEDGADDGDAESTQDVLDDLDFGDGAARITVGDTSYEFSLGGNSTVGGTTYIGVCQELFGLVAGGGYDVEGRAITVEFEIPPPDWESFEDGRFDGSPPRIEIDDEENDGGWIADMQLADNYPEAAGASQIDDWVSDGSKASGTATFIEVEPFGAPVEGAEPVQGSFELGCANDG